EIGMDGLIYLGIMTILALRSNTQANKRMVSHDASGEETPAPRILLLGEGLALSAYVSAVASIPEHKFELIGIVTPHRWHRTNTVGDYAVLGELNDIPDIVRDYGVSRIVVLQSTAERICIDELSWDDVTAPPIEQIEFMNSFIL